MITVSSCVVKLSDLEKERLKQWTYMCIFVGFLNIHNFFFLSTCGVICKIFPSSFIGYYLAPNLASFILPIKTE